MASVSLQTTLRLTSVSWVEHRWSAWTVTYRYGRSTACWSAASLSERGISCKELFRRSQLEISGVVKEALSQRR
jgi:hypothetical protein